MHPTARQKLTLILFFLIVATQLVPAQEIKINGQHEMSSSTKNIYLLIMDTMMTKMDDTALTSNPDLDFLTKMIPHHEGAIKMAGYEIIHGKNEEMKQLAKSILAEQANDIQVMKLIMQKLPGNGRKADQSFDNAMTTSMNVMMQDMPANDKLIDVDKSFAMVMIPHHQAAIDMAIALIKHSSIEQVSTFAKQLISAEQVEIEQMRAFIK